MASTKSILIVGGSGFIGTHLAQSLKEEYKVFATYCRRKISIRGVTFFQLNVEERHLVKRIVYITQPDVVIYVAGYYNWNGILDCEKKVQSKLSGSNFQYRELSQGQHSVGARLHADGPATLAGLIEIMQPKFIYLSHPYIFDGVKGNYHETDTVLPSQILGRMKSSGENVVRSKYLNYTIIRSSPVYGIGNGSSLSFLDQLRMNLERNLKCEVSNQELHSFAPVSGLCELISKMINSGFRNKTLHYGGLNRVTFYEFAQQFAKRFGYDTRLIVPRGKGKGKTGSIYTEDILYDYSLNSTQTIKTLKIKPFFLEEGFDLIQQQLIA